MKWRTLLSGRNFVDSSLFEDIWARNWLKLEITGNTSVKKHLHQRSIGHQKLGNKINIVLTNTAKRRIGLAWGFEVLPDLVEGQGSTFTTIVVIAVDVQDLGGQKVMTYSAIERRKGKVSWERGLRRGCWDSPKKKKLDGKGNGRKTTR